MSKSIQDRLADAGDAVADTAKDLGKKVVKGAEQAVEWAKDQAGFGQSANIRERMNVIASCGTRVGVVDQVVGNAIKLTRNDSPDRQHHYIPLSWVEQVDGEVRLSKNSTDAQNSWKSDAASCGCDS